MAYTLVFESKEKTLVDDEINQMVNNILESLKEKLNITLR